MPAQFYMHQFVSPVLRELVRSAWSVSYSAGEDAMPGIIAPDAHVELVFQTNDPCGLNLSGRGFATSPRAMLFALRRGTLSLEPRGANTIAALRVSPAVASVILGRPLADLWDEPVDLRDIMGKEATALADQLADTRQAEIGQVLEAWLSRRLADWSGADRRNLDVQKALFWRLSGEHVTALADDLGITTRTLRRHSERYAGLSPKQVSMSGRILRACIALRSNRTPIAAIASSVGFGDQAAFTNAFRHYVTMTPTQFRAEPIVYCEGA